MKKTLILASFISLLLLIAFSCQNDDEVIEVPISNMLLSSASDYIEVGQTDSLDLIIHPKNATNKNYTYSSNNTAVAQVDANGVVKGIAPGKATIKITLGENDLKSASHIVQVVKWTNYYNKESAHVRPIAVDSDNDVWIGGAELTRIRQSGSQAYSNIGNVAAIAVNNNDRWFATNDLGLWKYDGSSWTNYTKDDSNEPFGATAYNAMMIDNSDNLWFDSNNGVTMYDGNHWRTFTVEDGLVHNHVMNMATDNKGVKWFATSKGVCSFDDAQWKSYTKESCISVAVDKENNKWFGSYFGVLKFDGENWTHYDRLNSDLQWNSINAIAVDKDNNIWFATEGGVSKFDGEDWINYTNVDERGIWLHNVRAIDFDSKDNVWLGTTYGYVKLEQ